MTGPFHRHATALLTAAAVMLSAGFSAAADRQATILAVNDVYRINGVADGDVGGIARLRTLRLQLERTAPDLLLLHAGDAIAPSFLSRLYKGHQMIDALNRLDGRTGADGFDRRMFIAFGNHEFDDSRCASPAVLRDRVAESEFTWLASNIDFTACHGHPPMLPPARDLRDHALVTSGGIRIGLFALLRRFPPDRVGSRPLIRDFVAVARQQTAALCAAGAEVLIALTHLDVADDLNVLQTLGSAGPDLIVGGHDHHHMRVPADNPRVFKADADAVSASVITITLDDAGRPHIAQRFVRLDKRIARDPALQQTVDGWLARHAAAWCGRRGEASDCLDAPLGRTLTPVETEELKNRGRETGFGDWIADRMLAARADADVAILNSGTLRLNYDMPAGSSIRRRHLEELFGFVNPLVVIETSGAHLWRAMETSLANRGEGPWAHVAGLAAEIATGSDGRETLVRLMVRRRDGRFETVTRESTTRFRVVTNTFLACGGDGYDFGLALGVFSGNGDRCRKGIKARFDPAGPALELKAVVRAAIVAASRNGGGIAPAIDGRICRRGATPCLIADRWRRR